MAASRMPARFGRRSFLAGPALAAAWTIACQSKTKSSGPSGASPGQTAADNGQATGSARGYIAFLGRTGKPPSGSPVPGGTYKALFASNVPSLDPHHSVSTYTSQFASAVYSRLYRMKTDWDVQSAYRLQPEPDAAQSIESSDGMTWTIKLRPGVTFHDLPPVNGHPLEAEDVQATFERATSTTNVNRNTVAMVDAAKIATPDSRTLVFTLKYPYGQFPTILASTLAGWILPREVKSAGYDPSKQVIGSGPFVFDRYTPDVSITFRKNGAWFERGRPYVDSVEAAIVPDKAQQQAQFIAGNIGDVGLQQADLDAMKRQNPRAEVLTLPGGTDWLLFFQLGDPASPFQDIRLRQAASLALDRQTFGHVMFDDQAVTGFAVPLTQGRWALTLGQLSPDAQRWYRFDPAESKRLFDAAGGDKLSLKMLKPNPYPPDPGFTKAGEIVANMLAQAGWKAPLANVDYTREWLGDGKGIRYGNYPASSILWSGLGVGTNADDYVSGFWESSSQNNQSRLKDPKVDQMIAKARATLNEDEQVQAYLDVQKYLTEQVYCASGLPRGPSFVMVQPSSQHYVISGSGAGGVGTDTWSNLWLTR
jgi:peptide/nickel transport system substrate-binding protein